MEVSRKWQFHFFDDLASQRYYLPILSPTTSGIIDTNILPRNRCGKYVLSVERKAYFVCLERFFRQTEKWGMMCTAHGGQPRQEDSISSKTVTEIALK